MIHAHVLSFKRCKGNFSDKQFFLTCRLQAPHSPDNAITGFLLINSSGECAVIKIKLLSRKERGFFSTIVSLKVCAFYGLLSFGCLDLLDVALWLFA